MRFLHSKTLEFREFPNHEVVVYAILSHTWGPDEVLFHELDGLNAGNTPQAIKQKSGYQKIQACCAQAASDGFEYAWVDTCCIDKRSSAELSEAINSMYRWYQDCAVCYAYLTDVPNDVDATTQRRKFEQSRWFTRGWTLQELIAPQVLEFYGDQWIFRGQGASLGTHRSLSDVISDITRIPSALLRGARLSSYSIAQKMSWAAGRETTRGEDRAYSLMGLFNVNMPLLYGEGNRAFSRLQEELMKISADETLFAWRVKSASVEFLAKSPDDFAHSASIVQNTSLIGRGQRTTPSSVTNWGLRLEVILLKASDTKRTFYIGSAPFEDAFENDIMYIMVLNCHDVNSKGLVGITGFFSEGYAKPDNQFVRSYSSPSGGLVLLDPNVYQPSDRDRTTIFTAIRDSDSFGTSIPWHSFSDKKWLKMGPQGFRLVETWPPNLWEDQNYLFLRRIIVLLFDNGEDAFAVHSLFQRGGSFLIRVSLHPPGNLISEHCKRFFLQEDLQEDIRSLAENYCDRFSCKLNSGRMLYVAIRPQQVGHSAGYGLYIAVDGEQF